MREKRFIVWCEEDDTVRQMILTETNSSTIKKATRALNQSQIETPIMPFGTVLLKTDGTTSVFFIQKPPEKVIIRFRSKMTPSGTKPTHYTIAYPWRVFALMFKGSIISDYSLRFAKGPIRTMEDQLYRPPLPNIEKDAQMCMGLGMVAYVGTTGPLSAIADKVIDWVDKSNYNNDLATAVGLIPKEMNPPDGFNTNVDAKRSFTLWQAWTKEAERKWRDIVSLSWHPIETFEDFVGRIQ